MTAITRDEVIARAKASRSGNGTHPPDESSERTERPDEPLVIRRWPDEPDRMAYHGVLGEIVDVVEPHSEAAPIAIAAQMLVGFGNLLNRGPHWIAERDRHGLNLNVLIVGNTSSGRKGSSWSQARFALTQVDPDWKGRITHGLSSGEGLIAAVQDPVERLETKKDGKEHWVTVEPGVSDKRLMVIESEFARVLKVMGREGNTLSQVVRQAWDSGDLSTLTKQSVRATGAHISIIGHISAEELTRLLQSVDVNNGFLNRFLLVCAKRSKFLPDGGDLHVSALSAHLAHLAKAVDFGRKADLMRRDDDARDLWHAEYPRLSSEAPGLIGKVTSRAPAQVMRIACLYAVLDLSPTVRRQHLEAALALHGYVERSARYLFGDSLGDPVAERILTALRESPGGMTRTEIRQHFSRHLSKGETDNALRTLAQCELAVQVVEPTAGRPREVWRPAPKAPKAHKVADMELSALMAPPGKGEAWEGDE